MVVESGVTTTDSQWKIPVEAEDDFSKRSEVYAGEALNGMYMDCLAKISFSCVQKKVLNFINRMNRMEKFPVLGNYVSVVRIKNEYEKENEFQGRLDSAEKQSKLDELMDTAIDKVKVPNSFSVVKPSESRNFQGGSTTTTSLDFSFPYSTGVEGRKKGGGGGGKMGKKMMMMMMMGLKAKMMMLGPLILGMAGLMAIKALIASVISLTISKIMIIKKLMKNKGAGGGHGGGGWDSGSSGGGPWASGGGSGGGWDRRSIYDKNDETNTWDASDLAYRAYSTVENLF
ncbi:conserved hypothetical protein [Pediculus humanus corporis]|uniref:Osiris n=1 Tax=Pediculus humanus subsp. corporis TaxID=121224 RepID=E0VA14_PEDHC|nr:uncharacterized protein Phum_PHUM025350 [Pediculus humanus corporis]EEB10220.1 conserved hypothetical protein [Pediculus humanus corporis]